VPPGATLSSSYANATQNTSHSGTKFQNGLCMYVYICKKSHFSYAPCKNSYIHKGYVKNNTFCHFYQILLSAYIEGTLKIISTYFLNFYQISKKIDAFSRRRKREDESNDFVDEVGTFYQQGQRGRRGQFLKEV
jgi:hypothetical protein